MSGAKDLFEKLGRMNFHRLADADEDGHRRLAFSTLDVIDVLARDRSLRGKLFLSKSSGEPSLSNFMT